MLEHLETAIQEYQTKFIVAVPRFSSIKKTWYRKVLLQIALEKTYSFQENGCFKLKQWIMWLYPADDRSDELHICWLCSLIHQALPKGYSNIINQKLIYNTLYEIPWNKWFTADGEL